MDKNYKTVKIKTKKNIDNVVEIEDNPGPMEESLTYEYNYDLNKFKKYNEKIRQKRKWFSIKSII